MAEHCWHDVGGQFDPDEKCCWCGAKKVEYVHGNHGPHITHTTERVDRTHEPCPSRR
jgi:hypothetical protein